MKTDILKALGTRPVLVWGARMTGVGFARFARKHGLKVVGFVDSDPSFTGKTISGLEIRQPEAAPDYKARHKDLVILIAVSLKEDEIVRTLEQMGFTQKEYVKYNDFCRYFFTIDVAGVCNLKCPSCGHSMQGIKNPKGFMPLSDFKQITEKMLREADLVSHINLYSWGEPFLHPQLDLIIQHTHSLGIATAVSSSLSIPSSDQIEKIVKSSPDYLKVALSGYYPEVYSTTHTGGDINLVKSNMYKLRYLMDKYKPTTIVEVIYHLYKNNVGRDLAKMKELCDELGFIFASCFANVTPIERLIDYCEGRPDEQTRELSSLLLVGIDKALEITKPYRNLPCRFLTNQVNINWDRSVPLCCVCYDYTRSNVADDYLKEPLEAILKKREHHPLCKQCLRFGFPPYLIEVNRKEWEKEAARQGAKGGYR